MTDRTIKPERVVSIRRASGLSVAAFARECNVSRQTVYAWESGTKPPTGTSVRLLEILEECNDRRSNHREVPEGRSPDE